MLCQIDFDDDGIIQLIGAIFKQALRDAQRSRRPLPDEEGAVLFLQREVPPEWGCFFERGNGKSVAQETVPRGHPKMAYETRGNQQYYYQKRRVGKHVISVYGGNDIIAQLAAERDTLLRAKAAVDRERFRAVMAEQDAIDAQLDDIGEQLQQLVTAALLVAGYHQHKRVWRKIRGK